MNNTAWQRARREVGLQSVRIHDLQATFACRLRAVGVSMEDREVLLGHASHSMLGITQAQTSAGCLSRRI